MTKFQVEILCMVIISCTRAVVSCLDRQPHKSTEDKFHDALKLVERLSEDAE